MGEFLQVPQGSSGYLPILRGFRTKIPLATKDYYSKVKCEVRGNVPSEVVEHLPIFGAAPYLPAPKYHALNSGGRGILLSDGKTHLRFKGCDVDSTITQLVANAKNNHISDIRLASERLGLPWFDTTPLLVNETYALPNHEDKPFSFFTQESVEKEKYASDIIGNAFEKKGFKRPYTFEGSITYPQIKWQGKPCSTLVFSLPSVESDLRFGEIYRLFHLQLKFASPEELADISNDLGDFCEKLTTWHGFVTGIMHRNSLVPHETSHQHQNYVLSHVSDTEIGLSRVDHTSTIVNKNESSKYFVKMKHDLLCFNNLEEILLQALQLAKDGHKVNEIRHTGYFDAAYKWQERIYPKEIRGHEEFLEKSHAAFERGLKGKNPEPIPQKELIDLVQRVSKIRRDEEKQNKIFQHYVDAGAPDAVALAARGLETFTLDLT